MVIAQGNIKLSYTKSMGLFATDGIDYFKIISPYLLRKFIKHHKKISIMIAGNYLIMGRTIVFFRRDKKIINRYVDLHERYGRELIWKK